jgi:hypothetical protein
MKPVRYIGSFLLLLLLVHSGLKIVPGNTEALPENRTRFLYDSAQSNIKIFSIISIRRIPGFAGSPQGFPGPSGYLPT